MALKFSYIIHSIRSNQPAASSLKSQINFAIDRPFIVQMTSATLVLFATLMDRYLSISTHNLNFLTISTYFHVKAKEITAKIFT